MKVSLSQPDRTNTTLLVTFDNDERRDVYVSKARAFIYQPDGNYFDFEPSARYLGVAVKRGPYDSDELALVRDGESLSSHVDIAKYYDLPAHTATIRVRYRAAQPTSVTGSMVLTESDWLEIYL